MNAIAERSPINVLRDQITERASMFGAVLPAHIKQERYVRIVLTAVMADPELINADRASLFEAALKCAQDGLMPDKREAAFVVYNAKTKRGGTETWIKKVQYMPMVYGILKKVRNSGQLATISSELVYKNDSFRYWVDENGKHIEFEPLMFGDRGDLLGIFAIAKMKDGTVDIEPMTVADVNKVKACSKSPDKGPWSTWYDEKAKVACLKRLAKRLPQSTELDTMLTAATDSEDYEVPPRPRLADFQAPLEALPPPVDDDPGPVGEDGLTDEQREVVAQHKAQLCVTDD